jgi:NitT/TauT family transport system ATP-binding protein
MASSRPHARVMTSATLPYTSEPHAGNGALLKVDRVQIGYWGTRGYVAAVDDVSFEVQGREKVIVIGQSGSGKSTLLKTVGGYLQPTSGTVSINGNLSLTPGPDRAFVFQEFDQLFPWRTVLDNVAYPLRRNGWGRRDAQDRAREFLELTRLSHAIDRYPHELSGGMKQRPRRAHARTSAARAAGDPRPDAHDAAVRHALDRRGARPRRPDRDPARRAVAAGRGDRRPRHRLAGVGVLRRDAGSPPPSARGRGGRGGGRR